MGTSALKIVESKILNTSDYNRIWSYSDFTEVPFGSAAKALSILCQKKIIKRVQKGFYFRSKQTILGETIPDDLKLVFMKLDKKGAFYCVSGLSGFNNIGLTTQISNVTTIACDCPMINTDKIKFIQRKKPHSGTAIERIVLDALIDIDKISDTTETKTLLKIKELISMNKISINDLGISALSETARVRALVGALGQELNLDNEVLAKLKASLNPSTSYFLKVDSVLKYAQEWNIKSRNNVKIFKRK
ncbi:MAG: hypothetical protein PHC34_09955 [Candidatus Gastranaerophilales bacterium]|nr:hypothetical protein [Candidatus Gastranaerophilales bacterium]